MAGMTEAHNRVRERVGVPPLIWSEPLARFAGEWAEYLAREKGCALQHRPSEGKYRQEFGENLFWASAIMLSKGLREVQDISPDRVVRSWQAEARDFDFAANACTSGKRCGHYTQLVWHTTQRVGCGRAVCADKSQVWVCNYDPPGNVIGQRPF